MTVGCKYQYDKGLRFRAVAVLYFVWLQLRYDL